LLAAFAALFLVPVIAGAAPVASGTVVFENSDTPWAYFVAVLDYEVYGPGDPDNPVDAGMYPAVASEYTFVYVLRDSSVSAVPLDGLDVQKSSEVTITASGSIDDGDPSTVAPDGPAMVTAAKFSFDFFGGGSFPLKPGVSTERFFVITPAPAGEAVLTVLFDGTSEDEVGLGAGPTPPGAICGNVGASCYGDPPVPAPGVTIDLFTLDAELVESTLTDDAGDFCFEGLAPGDYVLTIVLPLDYEADVEEVQLTVATGETVTQNFLLICKEIASEPRTIGFWKHQLGVATGGKGHAHIDGETLCEYLDIIEAHFNSNEINPVVIYQPPSSGLCEDKLLAARDIIKLKGKVPMLARAKQQLMALLFNVASEKISLAEIISEDGANVSQAITFCDNEIDDPDGDYELAKSIADEINNGHTVPAGWIPLETPVVYYEGIRTRHIEMLNAFPTVFSRSTRISFTLAGGYMPVDLKVFDVTGRLVKTVANRDFGPGTHNVVWDGTNDYGASVTSGVYLYRIEAGGEVAAGKLIVRR